MRVEFGEYQLDTETRTLQREGRRIPVQSKAFDLLAYLIERRERVVCSDELLDALWPGLHVTPAALSTAVQKARQAVGDDGEHQAVLHTEHGKGFRFVAEVTDLSAPDTAQPTPETARSESAGANRTPQIAKLKRLNVFRVAATGLLAVVLVFVAIDHYVLEAEPERAEAPTEHAPAAKPVARGKSIAVLPFVNMSADPDQEYFADGISEELLNTLAHFEGLRVVGRTSSFSFKHSDADLKEMGEALNADVILEGSVRTAGDRVRITAQLNGAKDGFQRWSETYDRELTDIFAIQTEIATAIADALRVTLSPEEQGRLTTPATENLEAYQAYLIGKRRLAEGATAKAIEFFEKAIDLDPEFALAYVGRAYCFIFEGGDSSGLPSKEGLAEARAIAHEALALDGQLGEAHAALGSILRLENDFAGAEAAFQRAVALSPNSSRAFTDYGNLLGFDLRRYEEALALSKKAVDLDPLSVAAIQQVGAMLDLLGRVDESRTWHELALEIDPYDAGYNQLMDHHWFVTGRIDEALIAQRKDLIIDPNAWSYAIYGWLWLELGDPDEAERWISRAYEMDPEEYYANNALRALAHFRGDDATARVYEEKIYEIRPEDELTLTFLRDSKIREGRYAEARALYEEHYPELLVEGDPRVDQHNVRNAVDLAFVLDKVGERKQSELLRERSLEQLRSAPRMGIRGSAIFDARIHIQRGKKQEALLVLREAVDAGYRVGWWWEIKLKPDFEPLHDEPEYQAIVAEIEADMAAQLAHVRDMERNGELEPIPEIPATIH
jgi:TolB-like protein/DNA-binding winged helix-turn-helix (wHTH) protein